jgi:hypothetical protein
MDAKSVVDSGRGRSGFRGGCSRRSGRRQPPIRHVLAGSLDARIRSASQVSLLKERKKEKQESPFPSHFFSFFVRSLGASHPLPVARRGKISSIVAVFLSFTRKNNKNKKKIVFFSYIKG